MIFTAPKPSCGKVMFIQTCFSQYSPPKGAGASTEKQMVNGRAVRILLGCILVISLLCPLYPVSRPSDKSFTKTVSLGCCTPSNLTSKFRYTFINTVQTIHNFFFIK